MLPVCLLISISCAIETGTDTDGGPVADADLIEAPSLTCEPQTASPDQLCDCMAQIVCDQISFCLDPDEIASRGADWHPRENCVAALASDCIEDGPENQPADLAACVADLADATCDDLGAFTSVSADFPASCANLRALDTGLGIDQ